MKKPLDKFGQIGYNNGCRQVLRSWRNRQTRTFEGRMGNRPGSSPGDRTKKRKTGFLSCLSFFFKCNQQSEARLIFWS